MRSVVFFLFSCSVQVIGVRQEHEQHVYVVFRPDTSLWKPIVSRETSVSPPDPLLVTKLMNPDSDKRQSFDGSLPPHALWLPWIEWVHTNQSRRPIPSMQWFY